MDAYYEFMREEEKEKQIMQYKADWIQAQAMIKKTYFSNLQQEKFDEFLIHGFIGVMVLFILIIILCIVFRKYCTSPLVDQEQLDHEAYDDLKKEYMERRREKIAEQRRAQLNMDAPTEPSKEHAKDKM